MKPITENTDVPAYQERVERAVEKWFNGQAEDEGASWRERAKARTLARRYGRKAKSHAREPIDE